MRQYAYMFLKGMTQLLSIPFIIWVFMLVTFGVTELHEFSLGVAVIIVCVIILTTAALIPYLYMLFMTYHLLRTFEKKTPIKDSLVFIDKTIKGSLYYTGLMFLSLPFVYLFASRDDSKGIILLYIFVTWAGLFALAIAYLLKDVLTNNVKDETTHVKGN
ncbi:MAG: DUF2975 domain-containing protein [Bacillota bacterium]